MKLTQIFETTERGNSGGSHPTTTMSYHDAHKYLTELIEHDDDVFLFDDLTTKENDSVIAIVQTGHVDFTKPTAKSLSTAQTPDDWYGALDVEWSIVTYAICDNDDDIWTIHEQATTAVVLSNQSKNTVDEEIHNQVSNQSDTRDDVDPG